MNIFKKTISSQNDKQQRIKERLFIEFQLFKIWAGNKSPDNIFLFKPINIRKEDNPYYVDTIKYDLSARSKESAIVYASCGSDDKLLIGKGLNIASACCFRTHELKKLLIELQKDHEE